MNSFLKSIILAAIISLIAFGTFLFTGLGILIFLIIAIIIFVLILFFNLIKNILKFGVIIVLILVIIFYLNQTSSEKNKLLCDKDGDCICGGIDIKTGDCFIGSKTYYNLYVNKKAYCPDFCTGIANNLETKCLNNRCTLINKNLTQQ